MATTRETRTLAAAGLAFRALVAAGAGRPNLFLHATSFCAEVWDPAIEVARAAGLPGACFAVDQRGHGGSEAPPEPGDYAWTRLAEDAAALAEAVARAEGADRALLIGHSSGATASLAAAALSPERVAGLVLVEPVLFDPRAGGVAASFAGSDSLAERARRRRAAFESRDAARERLASRFPYRGFAPECLEAYLEGALAPDAAGGVALRCPPEREAWMYQGAAALDVWPGLERLRAPILLLLGQHSSVSTALRDRLRAAPVPVEVAVLAGGTHFAALEVPGLVGRAVARFARGLVA